MLALTATYATTLAVDGVAPASRVDSRIAVRQVERDHDLARAHQVIATLDRTHGAWRRGVAVRRRR